MYDDPIVYDVLMSPGTAAELDALARIEARHAPRPGPGARWLEPACGSGRLLRGALRRGRRVAGYDREPGMVAYARGRLAGASARVVIADLADPAAGLRALGGADLAFCPWNTLRHLPDDDALLAHLAQVAGLLRRGGAYAVGIGLQDFTLQGEDEDVWTGTRGSLRVTQVVNYLPLPRRRLERVVSHLVLRRPGGEEHRDHVFDLRTYTLAQWRRLVDGSALRIVEVCDAQGRPVAPDAALPYRLEILAAR